MSAGSGGEREGGRDDLTKKHGFIIVDCGGCFHKMRKAEEGGGMRLKLAHPPTCSVAAASHDINCLFGSLPPSELGMN